MLSTEEIVVPKAMELVKTPEDLVLYFQDFKHNLSGGSGNLPKVINFDTIVFRYFNEASLPRFTFYPSDLFIEAKEGSCYDLALLSYKVLCSLGYKCDMLHFGWTPKEASGFGIVSCWHMVCRFWVGESWFVLQGFLYKSKVCILGPFSSLEEFVRGLTLILIKELKKASLSIAFVDSLEFGDTKEVPTSIRKLYPTTLSSETLGYW